MSGTEGDSSFELLPVRSIQFEYTLYYVMITHPVIIVLEYIILKNV